MRLSRAKFYRKARLFISLNQIVIYNCLNYYNKVYYLIKRKDGKIRE